jgi:DNA mismatch repair ATPase MutS
MLPIYKDLSNQYKEQYAKLKKQFSLVAAIRLLIVVALVFMFGKFITTSQVIYVLAIFVAIIGFLILIKYHQKIKNERNLYQKLLELNQHEINYLTNGQLPFDDGTEYINHEHLYTFDLDVFGTKSLFQHLNRTSTPVGKNKLAQKLSNKLFNEEVIAHQHAIKELAEKIEFRQLFAARAKIAQVDLSGIDKLIQWSKTAPVQPILFFKIVRYVLPAMFILMVSLSIFSEKLIFTYLSNTFFLLNLSVFALYLKSIKNELVEAHKIHETIQQYAVILKMIHQEPITSVYLLELKNKLADNEQNAFEQFQELSKLFYQLSSIENPLGAVLFNGALLYHFGIYQKLLQWKQKKAKNIEKYLTILGEFDALNSLANFSFNNTQFSFPEINQMHHIAFKNCGHPLIPAQQRVCNDVTFDDHHFMILTGSNMSGKSTFLRTLGINMLLTNTGAPVCATYANVHPLMIIVSMRLNDSLSEGASYFFAEVKRLKHIMDELTQQKCFVLLDEILKGTNSDDKRQGTVKVIEKMVQKNAIGAIATHDLEVCNIANSYPEKLSNYCFEVEILNDELHFDYTLRRGICKNKSASFLMHKMGVI